MRVLAVPRWWRIPACPATRLGNRFISKSTEPKKPSGDAATPEYVSSSSASPDLSQTHDNINREEGRVKAKPVRFTTDEVRKFADLYGKGMSDMKIRRQMPHRSYSAIQDLAWRYRRGALDKLLRGEEDKEKPRSWTEEKMSLRELVEAGVSTKVLQSNFPDRSLWSVLAMAYNSGWKDHKPRRMDHGRNQDFKKWRRKEPIRKRQRNHSAAQ